MRPWRGRGPLGSSAPGTVSTVRTEEQSSAGLGPTGRSSWTRVRAQQADVCFRGERSVGDAGTRAE